MPVCLGPWYWCSGGVSCELLGDVRFPRSSYLMYAVGINVTV